MSDLHEIQRQIVAEIDCHPLGSMVRFKLMDAADKVSLAIDAIKQAGGAQTAHSDAAHHPETQQSRAPDVGAELRGHRP